jgi:hypothetical protein
VAAVRKRTRNGQPVVDKVRFQVGGRDNNVWESGGLFKLEKPIQPRSNGLRVRTLGPSCTELEGCRWDVKNAQVIVIAERWLAAEIRWRGGPA